MWATVGIKAKSSGSEIMIVESGPNMHALSPLLHVAHDLPTPFTPFSRPWRTPTPTCTATAIPMFAPEVLEFVYAF